MKTLTIKWQRLLDEKNQTCQRCGSTENEIEKALIKLKQSLAPLGMEIVLEKIAINFDTFHKDPSQSNRIWIEGKYLEEWTNAESGQSACCSIYYRCKG
ncbi:MAG: DUF2703 domain-containing protein [Nitrospirae bacterium]|nr:DUF2703 domain-containing protein [Nitrospirota bacterium]